MKNYRRRRRRYKSKPIKNHTDFIEQCKKKHGDKYRYTKTKYVDDKTSVIIHCKFHKDFTIRPKRMLRRRGGCPKCSNISNGESKTMLFLVKNKIKHTREYKFPGSQWRYDFYLPTLKLFIEYDGIQHFKPVRKFGGMKELEKSKQRDKDKDILAKMNNIQMIRIPYTEYDNLEDYLLFKLSKIYKYHIRTKYYRTFIDFCKGEKLPGDTKPKDVKDYLTYKEVRA